jgi:hypothetical protein
MSNNSTLTITFQGFNAEAFSFLAEALNAEALSVSL